MIELTVKDHKKRCDVLVELAEERAKAAGHTGIVDLDQWLTAAEIKLLTESLHSLPFHNPKPLPPEILASIPEHLRS